MVIALCEHHVHGTAVACFSRHAPRTGCFGEFAIASNHTPKSPRSICRLLGIGASRCMRLQLSSFDRLLLLRRFRYSNRFFPERCSGSTSRRFYLPCSCSDLVPSLVQGTLQREDPQVHLQQTQLPPAQSDTAKTWGALARSAISSVGLLWESCFSNHWPHHERVQHL